MTQTISCPGRLYTGNTLMIHRKADAGYYEDASAVCDGCKQRVPLARGRRMSAHWLDVTIHSVRMMLS